MKAFLHVLTALQLSLSAALGQSLAQWDLTGHASEQTASSTFTRPLEASVWIDINEQLIFSGPLHDAGLLPVTGITSSAGRNLHPLPAQVYLHIPINPSWLVPGENSMNITLFAGNSVSIVEVQIGIFDN